MLGNNILIISMKGKHVSELAIFMKIKHYKNKNFKNKYI